MTAFKLLAILNYIIKKIPILNLLTHLFMANIYIRTDNQTKGDYKIAIEKVKKSGFKTTQSEMGELLIRKWTNKTLNKNKTND